MMHSRKTSQMNESNERFKVQKTEDNVLSEQTEPQISNMKNISRYPSSNKVTVSRQQLEDGSLYDGEWLNGVPCGKGKKIYST